MDSCQSLLFADLAALDWKFLSSSCLAGSSKPCTLTVLASPTIWPMLHSAAVRKKAFYPTHEP